MNTFDSDNERAWAHFFYNLDIESSIEIETDSAATRHHVVCKMEQDYPVRRVSSANTQGNVGVVINKNVELTSALSVSFFADDSEMYNAHIYRDNDGLVVESKREIRYKPAIDVIFLRPTRSRT